MFKNKKLKKLEKQVNDLTIVLNELKQRFEAEYEKAHPPVMGGRKKV